MPYFKKRVISINVVKIQSELEPIYCVLTDFNFFKRPRDCVSFFKRLRDCVSNEIKELKVTSLNQA